MGQKKAKNRHVSFGKSHLEALIPFSAAYTCVRVGFESGLVLALERGMTQR